MAIVKYGKDVRAEVKPTVLLTDIPSSGTIFAGSKAKGITNNIKKEFKDRGRSFDILQEVSEDKKDLTLDESVSGLSIKKAGKNFIIDVPRKNQPGDEETDSDPNAEPQAITPSRLSKRIARQEPAKEIQAAPKVKPKESIKLQIVRKEKEKLETKPERIIRLDYEIKENLKKMRQVVDSFSSCLFCQQCKTVSVDAQFLLSHFHIIHSEDGVNDMLGENAQHCIARIKRYLRDIRKKEILFNYIPTEEIFILQFYRCSYCPVTKCQQYDDLFKHTASAHNTKVLTCNICHNIFLNYGSLISHVCSGPPTSATARARFACKVCHRIDLSSFLEFQTHIRKEHNTCEICFQPEKDQKSLHAHCARHDQDLMCMKCFVTFEKADSFRKHMFWKHSNEQKECATCHCPTWPHVYHFCLPSMPVPCHTCDQVLPNAAAFKVHNRQHLGSSPHICTQEKCKKSFISKSLLWKHQVRRHPELKESIGKLLYERKLKKEMVKFGCRSSESLEVTYKVMEDVLRLVSVEIERRKPVSEPEEPGEPNSPKKVESVLDAAIRSIMPESDDEIQKADESNEATSAASRDPARDAIQATIAGRSYTEDNSWQAGLDALLAGASVNVTDVPDPTDLPPDELFNTGKHDDKSSSEEDENDKAPVIGGLWNQDLMFVGGNAQVPSKHRLSSVISRGGGAKVRGAFSSPYRNPGGGPRLRGGMAGKKIKLLNSSKVSDPKYNVNLSESSDEGESRVPRLPPTTAATHRLIAGPRPLLDHDYCYAAFMMSQEPVTDTAEMDKILSNVAFDGFGDGFGDGYEQTYAPINAEKGRKKKKKKKDKKKRKKKKKEGGTEDSSDSSDTENTKVDMFGIKARQGIQATSTPTTIISPKKLKIKSPMPAGLTPYLKRGPRPKYHTPDVAKTAGVTAGTARPSFDTESSNGDSDLDLSKKGKNNLEDGLSEEEIRSSDLDTDFSADESTQVSKKEIKVPMKSSMKQTQPKPTLKLKIKLPPKQKEPEAKITVKSKKRRRKMSHSREEKDAKPLSKKMRESLALNQRPASSEEDPYGDSCDEEDGINAGGTEVNPAGNSEKEKLYCYCQCPHDDISEMIGCDAPDCKLEWFHFECVGIMVPPKGKWYCPQCTKRYGLE